MTPKAILYMSYDGLTDPLGQSQILPYLGGLAGLGYHITIVSFEKPERFNANRATIDAICKTSGLHWLPLKYHKSPPVLSTIYDLWRLRSKAKHLHREKNFSIVHCRSYLTALVGLWMKKRFDTKFIFDMRGFWADERVEGGLWKLSSPVFSSVYKFFKKKEQEFIRVADATVVLTDAAREVIVQWKLTDRLHVIPCCVDLGLFDPRRYNETDRTELRKALNIAPSDFVLLYLGSLGTWYLYDDMVAFFNILKKKRPNARFLFLTPDSHAITPDANFVVRSVSRAEVPRYIHASDASICYIKPSFSKKGSSATKMAEVMAMGVPVVTNPGWGDVAFLHAHMAGLYLAENEALAAEALANAGRPQPGKFFDDWFSLQKGVERYAAIYQILNSR